MATLPELWFMCMIAFLPCAPLRKTRARHTPGFCHAVDGILDYEAA